MSVVSAASAISIDGFVDAYVASVACGFPMKLFEEMRPTLRRIGFPLNVRFDRGGAAVHGFVVELTNSHATKNTYDAQRHLLSAAPTRQSMLLKQFLDELEIDASIVRDLLRAFKCLNLWEFSVFLIPTDDGVRFKAIKKVPYVL